MSKFKVGDKVRIIRALGSSVECGLKYGDETEIIQTIQSSSGHTDYILRCPNPLYVGDGGFFLEHEIEPVVADCPQNKKQKHVYIEADSIPVGKAYGINKVESDAEISLEGALAQSINDMMAQIADGSRRLFAPKPDHKAEMQKAVAEMIVELLDKKTEVKLGAYSNIGLTTVDDHFPRRNLGLAELAKSDEWDTLTGLYVALSKATRRDLPDWIYGKEDPDGIS